jgi:hypothetical protein
VAAACKEGGGNSPSGSSTPRSERSANLGASPRHQTFRAPSRRGQTYTLVSPTATTEVMADVMARHGEMAGSGVGGTIESRSARCHGQLSLSGGLVALMSQPLPLHTPRSAMVPTAARGFRAASPFQEHKPADGRPPWR